MFDLKIIENNKIKVAILVLFDFSVLLMKKNVTNQIFGPWSDKHVENSIHVESCESEKYIEQVLYKKLNS